MLGLLGDRGFPDEDVEDRLDDVLQSSLWAMEAVRMHGVVASSDDPDDAQFGELDLGFAVAAVETGTLSVPAAVLMKAGFGSRNGDIKAVAAGNADFEDVRGLVRWATSWMIVALGHDSGWPTPETHELWESFVAGLGPARARAWRKSDDAPTTQRNRVRVFVDFWNYTLSVRHVDREFLTDWSTLGPVLAEAARHGDAPQLVCGAGSSAPYANSLLGAICGLVLRGLELPRDDHRLPFIGVPEQV